jgi:hypothetical protein
MHTEIHPRLKTGYLQPAKGLLPKYVPNDEWIVVQDVHLGAFAVWSKMEGTLFCDVDGTVADLTHRRVYVVSKPKNWPAFERSMHLDTPITTIIDHVKSLRAGGWKVVVMTGRGAQNKSVTEDWLGKYGVEYEAIYTRALKDYRKDSIVKLELMQQAAADGWVPDLVFDDRNQVVDMWRAENVPCIQVAEGDF